MTKRRARKKTLPLSVRIRCCVTIVTKECTEQRIRTVFIYFVSILISNHPHQGRDSSSDVAGQQSLWLRSYATAQGL